MGQGAHRHERALSHRVHSAEVRKEAEGADRLLPLYDDPRVQHVPRGPQEHDQDRAPRRVGREQEVEKRDGAASATAADGAPRGAAADGAPRGAAAATADGAPRGAAAHGAPRGAAAADGAPQGAVGVAEPRGRVHARARGGPAHARNQFAAG